MYWLQDSPQRPCSLQDKRSERKERIDQIMREREKQKVTSSTFISYLPDRGTRAYFRASALKVICAIVA